MFFNASTNHGLHNGPLVHVVPQPLESSSSRLLHNRANTRASDYHAGEETAVEWKTSVYLLLACLCVRRDVLVFRRDVMEILLCVPWALSRIILLCTPSTVSMCCIEVLYNHRMAWNYFEERFSRSMLAPATSRTFCFAAVELERNADAFDVYLFLVFFDFSKCFSVFRAVDFSV